MRTERQRTATAYHEAGHAVMRLELGRRLVRATIKPTGDTGGHVLHRRTKLDVEWFDPNDWCLTRWAQTEVMVTMAGPEAERRLTGRRNNFGAQDDDKWILDVALQAEGYGDKRRNVYLEWLRLKVMDWVASRNFWLQVEAVAAALLERETLSGVEVRLTCRRAMEDACGPLPAALILATRRA